MVGTIHYATNTFVRRGSEKNGTDHGAPIERDLDPDRALLNVKITSVYHNIKTVCKCGDALKFATLSGPELIL